MTEQDELKQYGQIVAKAWSDPTFTQQLRADPAGTLRAEGVAVPADMEVRVLEPDGPRLYMPLPAELPDGEEPAEWVALWQRAQSEPDFKARLLAEPAAVLAEAGLDLPADVPVEVVEVSDTQGYIAVPPAPEGLDADAAEDVVGFFCSWKVMAPAWREQVEPPPYYVPGGQPIPSNWTPKPFSYKKFNAL